MIHCSFSLIIIDCCFCSTKCLISFPLCLPFFSPLKSQIRFYRLSHLNFTSLWMCSHVMDMQHLRFKVKPLNAVRPQHQDKSSKDSGGFLKHLLHLFKKKKRRRRLANAKQNHKKHSRAILVASVENHERVRLAKEVLFVQLVGTKLHSGTIL